MGDDLSTLRRNGAAIFAPALNSAYAKFAAKTHMDVPGALQRAGVFNFFDWDNGLFQYDWALVSAGEHLSRQTKKLLNMQAPPVPAIIAGRDKQRTNVICDSGGFQIQGGSWEYLSLTDKQREALCRNVIAWQESCGDFALPIDIPTGSYKVAEFAKKSGFQSYDECLQATLQNMRWFEQHQSNPMKVLNVFQGDDEEERIRWYEAVKHFPHGHEPHGWALSFRAFNMDVWAVASMLKRARRDCKLGTHLHVLGTCATESSLELSILQEVVRDVWKLPTYTITYDASTPYTEHLHGRIVQLSAQDAIQTVVLPKRLPPGMRFPFINSPTGKLITTDDIRGARNWTDTGNGLVTSHNLYTYLQHNIQRNNLLGFALYDANAGGFKPNYRTWRDKMRRFIEQ